MLLIVSIRSVGDREMSALICETNDTIYDGGGGGDIALFDCDEARLCLFYSGFLDIFGSGFEKASQMSNPSID